MVNVLEQEYKCTEMQESEGKNRDSGNLVTTSAEFLYTTADFPSAMEAHF
jgi:hypothetical protein